MSNPYLSLLKTSWQFARNEQWQYILVYGLFIITSLGTMVVPLLYGWLVDALQQKEDQTLSAAWIYVGGYIALQLLISGLNLPARLMERQLAFNISRNFLGDLFQQLLFLPVDWHMNHHTGSTINRLRKAYGSLKLFFQNGFFYLTSIVQFILSIGAIIFFSPMFGCLTLLVGILTIWIILQFDKPFIRSLEDVNEKEHVVLTSLTDSLVNILTVITLRLEKRMQIDLLRRFKEMNPSFRRNIIVNQWKWFTANMLIALIYCIMVIGYIYDHYIPGEIFYLGGLVALLGFVNQFTSAFSQIARAYAEIVAYHTDVQTVMVIRKAAAKRGLDRLNPSFPTDWHHISIENLNFSFQGIKDPKLKDNFSLAPFQCLSHLSGKKEIRGLQNIQLNFERGKRVALIGDSGCGKSTLLALLRGLYTPLPHFDLKIDGGTVGDWNKICDLVTFLPQEAQIFENTLFYNITLGLPFNEKEVMEVCDLVCFTEVINQLPNRLETNIQENGVNLSGGQKQRLALARGVLAALSSSIVLLDEPTSSVDPQTELQIYQRLFNAFPGKLLVSSLHRLSLLYLFDYIYVLQEGKIIEEGTFEELKGGKYLNNSATATVS